MPKMVSAEGVLGHQNRPAMNVVDLFCGRKTWSSIFVYRGHNVTTLDNDLRCKPDILIDFMALESLEELENDGRIDVVLASPPCTCFSRSSMRTHWGGGYGAYEPITQEAAEAMNLVKHLFKLIRHYRPTVYVVENPVGIMSKIAPVQPNAETWYCQWGMPYAKPTHIWTNLNMRWPKCSSGGLDHLRAGRGTHNGLRGLQKGLVRAEIPKKLALAVARASERFINEQN